MYNRNYDEALAAANTALKMEPNIGIAHSVLYYVYIAKEMRDELLAYQRQNYGAS